VSSPAADLAEQLRAAGWRMRAERGGALGRAWIKASPALGRRKEKGG
jgi:hypothetical protein